jgi:putative ABC transport system ATP-binding protein
MLELKKIRKTFNPGQYDEVRALQSIDLRIEEGSFLLVVGTNGSGKTTLLNLIAGTVEPDEGSVLLGGRDITRTPEHARAREFGHVFQNPFHGTAPRLTVAENIVLAAGRGRRRGLRLALTQSFRGEIRERLSRLRLGLEERIDTPVGTLSGGQRQALTLMMAVWNKPRLLLLDEHTSALDPKSADMVIRLSNEIILRDKITTLMVTHSMRQGADLGDRLIMLHKGSIIQDFTGPEKRRLRAEDLLMHFEEVRRVDRLDESAAGMLRRLYV